MDTLTQPPASSRCRANSAPCSVLTFHIRPDPASPYVAREDVDAPRAATAIARTKMGVWPILWRPGKPPVLAVGLLQDAARTAPPTWTGSRHRALDAAQQQATSPEWCTELRRASAALDLAPTEHRDMTTDLLNDIAVERYEQSIRFGARTLPIFTAANGIDPAAVAQTQRTCDAAESGQHASLFDILHEEYAESREHGISDAERAAELVQVAAVALSAAEMLLHRCHRIASQALEEESADTMTKSAAQAAEARDGKTTEPRIRTPRL